MIIQFVIKGTQNAAVIISEIRKILAASLFRSAKENEVASQELKHKKRNQSKLSPYD